MTSDEQNTRDYIEYLKGENARLRIQLREAMESERRIWRAFAMAKGAAERATAVGAMVGPVMDIDTLAVFNDELDAANDNIIAAEKLAGCAVEVGS